MATGTIQDSMSNIRTLTLAHSAAVAVNEVIVSSSGVVLVAINAALANIDNAYMYMGKGNFPKEAPLVINTGDKVYWDATAGKVTKTSAGNTYCGVCVEAAASAATTVTILLMPDFTNIGSMDSSVIKVDIVNLTNAQIKALRATPKTLVAAPGATKSIELISAILKLTAGANVLTEAADNMAIRYTDGSGVIVSQTIEATGFIDQAANTFTNALPKIDAIAAATGALNQALVLHNTGDGEYAGNAAADATMRVRIVYRVHDWS